MIRVTLRGLQGHLLRLLLTAAAVMVGVSFVTGTFVLRDSMDQSLQSLFSQAYKGTDVSVRAAAPGASRSGDVVVDPTGALAGARPGVPLVLETELRKVPGVSRVTPAVQGTAVIAGKDGTAVRSGGAPGLGFAYLPDDTSFTLVEGAPPTGPHQVAVESATLAKSQLAVGDTTIAVIGNETRTVTITGKVEFGSLFGATAVLFDADTARLAFARDGTVASISVTAEPGVSQTALRAAVATTLPAGLEAVTGETVSSEGQASVATGLRFFTTFMLTFAGVSLSVGSFIIVNTFTMVVGQRTRELAVLRAVGASRAQVIRVVLGEAAVVGLVGSLLGVALGLAIAAGAKVAIATYLGADLGSTLPLSVTTVVASIVVGTLVTIAAATLPALRASRIPPIAAMTMSLESAPSSMTRRAVIGAVAGGLGLVVLTVAVTREAVPWAVAAVGAGLLVLGVLVLAPALTRPVVKVMAWPLVRALGVVGRLAAANATRVPRRTAATASALMVGLALIASVSVVASSAKASIARGVSLELTSDYVLTAGGSPVPGSVVSAAAALPSVASASSQSAVPVTIGSFSTVASVLTSTGMRDNVTVSMQSGQARALRDRSVLVDASTAAANGWRTGDTLEATVGALAHQKLTIGGIFADSAAFSSHLVVDRSLYLAAVPASNQADTAVYVKAVPGADPTALRTDLVLIVRPFLVVSVLDAAEFAQAQGASLDTVLGLLYVLLLFSVIVAVLGIINTMALSVFERTREIGLLRAVGLRRRQLALMITAEAIITAVFGAVLGVLLGLGLGVALRQGLRSEGLTVLAIPWTLVATLLIASTAVGVVAAVLPSARAVRLNILTAIATP